MPDGKQWPGQPKFQPVFHLSHGIHKRFLQILIKHLSVCVKCNFQDTTTSLNWTLQCWDTGICKFNKYFDDLSILKFENHCFEEFKSNKTYRQMFSATHWRF